MNTEKLNFHYSPETLHSRELRSMRTHSDRMVLKKLCATVKDLIRILFRESVEQRAFRRIVRSSEAPDGSEGLRS